MTMCSTGDVSMQYTAPSYQAVRQVTRNLTSERQIWPRLNRSSKGEHSGTFTLFSLKRSTLGSRSNLYLTCRLARGNSLQGANSASSARTNRQAGRTKELRVVLSCRHKRSLCLPLSRPRTKKRTGGPLCRPAGQIHEWMAEGPCVCFATKNKTCGRYKLLGKLSTDESLVAFWKHTVPCPLRLSFDVLEDRDLLRSLRALGSAESRNTLCSWLPLECWLF